MVASSWQSVGGMVCQAPSSHFGCHVSVSMTLVVAAWVVRRLRLLALKLSAAQQQVQEGTEGLGGLGLALVAPNVAKGAPWFLGRYLRTLESVASERCGQTLPYGMES